jgi:hypothetical protein
MHNHADKHDEWVASSKDRTTDNAREGSHSTGSSARPSKSAASAKAHANLAVMGSDADDDGDSVGVMI